MISTPFERYIQRQRIPVADSYLTQREYQCVRMYMDGVRRAEMAAKLGCSRRTIEGHMRVARDRVGANTTHQLIAMVASADALRGRGRSSNRDSLERPRDERASTSNRVDALDSTIDPGTAPSRAL